MAGSREGGLKAARKNLEKNPNFYSNIGSKGGKFTGRKGFAIMAEENPDLHRNISKKGGVSKGIKAKDAL